MKLPINKLNDKDIQTIGEAPKAMTLSANAHAMVFKTFTSTLYADPIGTVIREIASNCFDAHVEAGTDSAKNPVVVELRKDVAGNTISFIDKGVGMSPDRVYNIYGSYFESTKNETNDQIGGFGVGGKTPLAYTDSFFVITRKDGVEYTYNIFEGNESPMIELMSQETTKEVNGTEVRVPIKESDVYAFEKKTLRQLFYFENIVFKGFSDDYVSNDYNIYKGKTFLYRGDSYGSAMHVCLGKVAYPLDFNALGIDSSDYHIPVAVKLEIGELEGTGVNISREALQYSTANIKIITKKLEAVKAELMELLSKQYDNVQTVDQYYDVVENLGYLELGGEEKIYIRDINRHDVVFPNFKYNDIKMPKYDQLVSTFYDCKTYGKRESTRGWRNTYKKNFASMKDFNNVYFVDGKFKRVVLKQSYLQYNDDRFFLHTPKVLSDTAMSILKNDFGLTTTKEIPLTKKQLKKVEDDKAKALANGDYYFESDMFKTKVVNVIPKKKAESLIEDLIAEVHAKMTMYAKNYDDLVVPEDYVALRKSNRMSASVLKTGIPVKNVSYYGYRCKMTMQQFQDLKGSVYYGFADDKHELDNASNIFENISGSDKTNRSGRYGDTELKGTLFAQISKGNEKYMKMLGKKAIHVKYFYQTYVARKIDMILENKANAKAESIFDEKVLSVFSRSVFEKIDSEIYEKANKISNSLEKHKDFYYVQAHKVMNNLNIDIENVEVEFKHKEELEYLTEITDNCRDRLMWISFPHSIEDDNKSHIELIEMVNLCIDK